MWHKQTSEQFSGFVMPERGHAGELCGGQRGGAVQDVVRHGRSGGGDGDCGAGIQAVRRGIRGAQSERAAEKAWTWLVKFPNVRFRNPQGVATGEYGDGNCADEALWAAAELWRTTGNADYQQYFLAHYAEFAGSIRAGGPQSWPNVGNLGLWTYVLGGGKDAEAGAAIRKASLTAADQIVERTKANAYRHSLTSRDYIWGSNAVAANYGMQLLVANAFEPKAAVRGGRAG